MDQRFQLGILDQLASQSVQVSRSTKRLQKIDQWIDWKPLYKIGRRIDKTGSVLLVLKEEHGERGEIIYFAAKKEFENQRYNEALSLVKKSISRMPEQPEAHVLQARIYEYQENWQEARRAWHRYQSLQPESELGYRSLISAYRQTGDLDALVQRWQPYYLTNPENEQLRKYLREILFRLGRYDEAAEM